MILPAARMRAWMMAALPITTLAGILWHAGGAAAGIVCWMAFGALLLKKRPVRYPGQRRLGLSRLFFSCALGCAVTAAPSFFLTRFFAIPENTLHRALLYFGCACFSLTACGKALSRPLPRKLAWLAGALLSALFVFFCFV